MITKQTSLALCVLLCLLPSAALAIVAGDPNTTAFYQGDNPNTLYNPATQTGRLDTLGTASPFSGVGSINGGTGTLLDATHVLTAAHLFNQGFPNTGATFVLTTAQGTVSFQSSQVDVNPLYPNGIGKDDQYDIAVVTLSTPVPDTFHTYSLYNDQLTLGTTVTLVGYGQNGNGVQGYANADGQRRVGQNTVGGYLLPGGRTSIDPYQSGNPTYLFDFDSPVGSANPAPDYLVGPSLGNGVETTIGVGDSGGPAFVLVNEQYQIAAINNFNDQFGTMQAPGPTPGHFGSGGGGAIVSAYSDFISNALSPTPEPSAWVVFTVGGLLLTAVIYRKRKRMELSQG